MKEEKIITRKDEIRYTTSDPKKMLGRFICRNVIKRWEEVFLLDNGETTSVTRNEVLFERGTYIDQDTNARIRSYMSAGDITEIEVSNQNRQGVLLENNFLHLYRAVVNINDKKYSYLLYATSVQNANTIVTDFVELNKQGGFYISEIKEIDNCYVIIDKVDIESKKESIARSYLQDEISGEEYSNAQIDVTGTNPDYTKMNFYNIKARVLRRTPTKTFDEITQTVIVYTYTATRANILLQNLLVKEEEKRYKKEIEKGNNEVEPMDISTYIEESKTMPFHVFIPRDFSVAYQDE